jgi:non-specific serine/threonine protein kinase
MVTQRIKGAIKKIHASDPVLGRHLGQSVRTGIFCSYAPRDPVSWTLS